MQAAPTDTPRSSMRAAAPRALGWLVALIVLGAVGTHARGLWLDAERERPRNATDGVAVYLPAVAALQGRDLTDASVIAALMQAEQPRGMQPGVVSTLYPPTMALLVRPLAARGWPDFVPAWRGLLLCAYAAGAAAVGGHAGMRHRGLGLAAGAAIAVLGWPLVGKAVELGTANLLIAGVFGAALAAAAAGRDAGVAGFAVLGAAIKLVPGVAVWPLLAAGRWRALAVGAAVAVALFGATALVVPPDRIVGSVLGAVRFQQGVVPAWTAQGGALRMALGAIRLVPLAALTFGAAAVCAWAARAHPARPTVVAGGVALGAAWLASSGAAVGVFYGLLAVPVSIWVALWGLERDAPRAAWLALPLAGVPALLVRSPDGFIEASYEMFLACGALWLAAALRLGHAAAPCLRRRGVAALGAVALVAGAATAWTLGRPPPPPPTDGRPAAIAAPGAVPPPPPPPRPP